MKVFKTEAGMRMLHESYDRLVALWGITTEQRDMETSYGKTHVILAGDIGKPPLLAFHGVGDNSALMWVFNARELSRHFRLIAVDTMGGAGKSVPDERYGRGFDLSRWLGDVMSALDIGKTYAIGVSYGCYHVQLLQASFPQKVERFVGLVGSIATPESRTGPLLSMLRMMKMMLPEALFPTYKNAIKLAKKIAGPGADVILDNEELSRHFWLLMKHYSPRAQMVHSRRAFNAEELAAMRDKALFLIGDSDRMVNASTASRAFEEYGMRYKLIKGAGHAINQVKADEVNAEIIGFFAAPQPVEWVTTR